MKRQRYGEAPSYTYKTVNNRKQKASTQLRQTSAVVRRTTPLYRPLGGNQIYIFKRQIQQPVPINQTTGWIGGGFDMCIAPALATCDFRIDGTVIYSRACPNVTEFTALFDQYKILRCDCRIIFSANNADTSNVNHALLVVHIMNDYNSTGAQTLAEYQQHPELKTFQMGQDRQISWSFCPHVRGDLLTQGGTISSSCNNQICPWIDTTSTTIEMLGTRIYLNNMGRTSGADLGTVLFMVDYVMAYKFVK